MTDFEKFSIALNAYWDSDDSEVDQSNKYKTFQDQIKNLKCEDFRFYYFRAHFFNSQNKIDEAKCSIDRSIELISSIDMGFMATGENSLNIFLPPDGDRISRLIPMPTHNGLLSNIYYCAGEIYARAGDFHTSLKNYQIGQYYNSFLNSEFSDSITLYSFRRYNEYSLADLINNTITVCPSSVMNDPFDSIINLWGSESQLIKRCKEQFHIKPFSASFEYFRIRSFCLGKSKNRHIKNILMWSHYADNHTGFCIKYKFSKHFIKQEENPQYEHMYLKKIIYTNKKVDISSKSIDSNLAYATKNKIWKYENEVRLIVYNPNKTEKFYGIDLDDSSQIEAIYFGYRCPDSTIDTIVNLFRQCNTKTPIFYKMIMDESNVYNLKCDRLKI